MAAKPIGFAAGFVALISGLGWLVRRPAKWPHALVPALVLVALETLALGLGLFVVRPWIIHLIGDSSGALGRFGRSAAEWVGVAVVAVAGWLLAVPLSPALSAPALERLVEGVERELGVPARAPMRWLSEMVCGFRAAAIAFLMGSPILVALWAVGFLLPVVLPLATALQVVVGACIVAWGLFDYPLTLRAVGVRQRLAFLGRHPAPVLGFGAASALAFWISCCGVLLLPVAVVAATRLLWAILDQHPEELPTLLRPVAESSPESGHLV